MSLLDIFRLVGFATGATLHFYLVWLLSLRRGLRLGERALLALGISLGAWHLGNFLASAYALIGGTGAPFSASPVASDGKLYFSSEDGDIFVVRAGPKYEFLSKNPVGEVLMATPAVSDGFIIVRGLNHLFAFGDSTATKKTARSQN